MEVSWAANRTPDKIAKIGLVAFLKAVRTLLLIATVTYGLLLGAAWLLDALAHPANASALRDGIAYLERLNKALTLLNERIASKIAFAVALFGLTYLIYRRHCANLITQVSVRVASEIERLHTQRKRGEWPELQPTGAMEDVRDDLARLQTYAESVDDGERARIMEIVEALERRWRELDFTGRFDLAESPPTESSFVRRLWPHLPALLTSRGFMRDSGLPAKALSYVGTAIMCLSLVGVSGTLVQPRVEAVVHASELAVSADQADAQRSWDKVRAEFKEDPQLSRLPLEAHELAHRFVNAYFSNAYFSSPAWHSAENTVRLGHMSEGEAAAAETKIRQLEERLARRLEQEAVPSLQGWFAKKLDAYKRSYAEPAEPSATLKAVMGKVLDLALDPLPPDSVPTAVKELDKAPVKGVKAAVELSIETQFGRFITELSGDLSLEASLSHVAHVLPEKAGLTPAAVASFSGDVKQQIAKPAEPATRDPASFELREAPMQKIEPRRQFQWGADVWDKVKNLVTSEKTVQSLSRARRI